MANPYLHMSAIQKAFPGVVALDKAELSVNSGSVMALMGANGAGKSTLMNVLGGIVTPDEGEILINGRPVILRGPIMSIHEGIAFVHQELNSLPTMSIAENIFIDDFPQRFGQIDLAACNQQSQELLKQLGCTLDPQTLVSELGIGDRQLIEIARALRRDPKVLIFDEPTSSLSHRERIRLFDVIRGLKQKGAAVIYISHFVDEIFEVCDEVTIMRNGRTVLNSKVDVLNGEDVVQHMLGDQENQRPFTAERPSNPPVMLQAKNLYRQGVVNDVSLTVRAGEVVGLWGLLGSGRTELLRSLVGLDPLDSGTLDWYANGEPTQIDPSTLHARAGFITEDRRGEGVFLPMSVSDNIVMPQLNKISTLGLIRSQIQRKIAGGMIERLGIKVSDQNQIISTLSGGNQQKVVFARWLATAPELLLLDEPTRGLDVGAKTEILGLVNELANAGTAVLLVSSEIEELTRLCDRYLVIVRGKIVAELDGKASHRELMAALSLNDVEGQAA